MVEPRFEQYVTAGVPVVVMVSGGGDSVALLHLLVADGRSADLTVYHLNHQMRGVESEADAAFVAQLAEQLSVRAVIDSHDVAGYAAAEGLNTEDAGRRVRYERAESLLDERCAEAGVDPRRGRILTAHTRDDRIETFFARAASGAGTTGLSSIPRSRGRIVRPLLDMDRDALREHLREVGAEWREDATNQDTTRERAFIRHRILPALEELNPRYRENLARTMDLVADDDALLQSMADGFAGSFSDDSILGEFVTLNLMFMRSLDRTMARRVVRTVILQTFPEASRLESAHIQRITDALAADTFAHDLPGGLRAETRGASMRISRVTPGADATFADTALEVPGTTVLGGADGEALADQLDTGTLGTIEVCEVDIARAISEIPAEQRPTSTIDWARAVGGPHLAVIAADALLATLTVGPPREGERYAPLGLDGTKKLSDILVDSKVLREARASVPVVRDGRNPAWVVGQPPSQDYRVVETTERALIIRWVPAQSRRN